MRYALITTAAAVALAATPAYAIGRTTTQRAPMVSAAAVSNPTAAAATTKARKTKSAAATKVKTRAKAPAAPAVVVPAAVTAAAYDQIDSAILNTFRTETFGAVLSGSGAFSDTFTFTLDADYLANSQVSTIDLSGIGIDFTSVLIDGFAFTKSSTDPETWVLDPAVSLMAGVHNIFVNGTIGSAGTGSYSGNINLTAVQGAVPEPGTWLMMLLGFGAAGYTMRRRPRRALVQMA